MVEGEAFAVAVLVRAMQEGRLDDCPVWTDLRTFDGRPWRGVVDTVIAGFPCQDISTAGRGEGIQPGNRSGLWYEVARVVREVGPRYVFLENVAAITLRGLDVVLGGLAEMGFAAEWLCLNPAFVEWLMGFPPDWTRPTGWTACGGSATASSPPRPNSPSRSCTGDSSPMTTAEAQPGYEAFLLAKARRPRPAVFEAGVLPAALHAWQAVIARWTCRLGRAAIFAGCGLGKTLIQLAWADQVRRHTGMDVLVLTPLAVGPQTVAEAAKFGIDGVALLDKTESLPALRATVARNGPVIAVANYQKLLAGKIDPSVFGGVVLDESSILKSYMGATKRLLVKAFAHTRFKLCCTATPAPNDHMELGNHAEFLGVMPANEMLARWFVNDASRVGTYRLKAHGEADFWAWVASWAVCVDRPSDLGYPDDGYALPPLNWHQHVVAADLAGRYMADADGQRLLVPVDRITATSLHREMRLTAEARASRVADLVNDGDPSPWLVWCNTDYEADALAEHIPDAVEVRGSLSDAKKEERLLAFSGGKIRVLITKPSIAGFGMNWQHCRRMAFVGLSYSHEQLYQAVRRCWRFGQGCPVDVHVVLADTEGEVLAAIKRKEADHDTMRHNMTQATREAVQADSSPALVRPERRSWESESGRSKVLLGDCVEATREMPPDSVDFTVYSPPFAGLYIYSDAQQDMGNCADDAEFLRHYAYLAPELLRVTLPGRLCAVHCKDLPKYAGRDGSSGLKDLPGWLVKIHEDSGWVFHSRVTIWKCPVTERERTNNNGLLHKTVKRDSSQIRQGMADYLLVFRKPSREGDGLLSAVPIERPAGFHEWKGDPASDPLKTEGHPSKYARKPKARKDAKGKPAGDQDSIRLWQRYAEPVWWDIDQTDVLNKEAGTGAGDERHICPLQIGLIRRAVYLWSLPGELVFSPFAGIGSEGVGSLLEHRRFLGVELKPSYWEQAQRNLLGAERNSRQRGLFDHLEVVA